MTFKQLQGKAGGLVLALFALGAAVAPARAEGQIYLCVDAGGHRELTDSNKNASCKMLDLPGAITSPPKRTAVPNPNGAPAPAAAPAAPADFPKIDNAQQKARDADRRQILQDELKGEEQKMAVLKKDFNGGEPERNGNERNYAKYQERVAQMKDDIARVEKNIDALKREIAGIR